MSDKRHHSPFPHHALRALLLAQGSSFLALSREFACDEKNVRRVATGESPGIRGKALLIRKRFESLFGEPANLR